MTTSVDVCNPKQTTGALAGSWNLPACFRILKLLTNPRSSRTCSFLFFLSSSSSSASTYVVFSMASRPGFSDYTTSTMGCIVVGVVALRPRKTSSVVSHVKLNRTSRGVPGSRFHRSSRKLERNNRARAKVKPPPPEFSQGCSITGSGRRLTICPDSQIPQ